MIFDLFHRWDWIRAFYSNEGVLPNHNHLFQFKEGGQVWSVYHSFSSVDEAFVAFLVTLFFFVCFTIGWKTRAFHAVSLVCLIGLSARNTLAEGPGNSVAIALLFVTLFMPLGLRFSVDSLRRSFEQVDEHTPDELNDRSRPEPERAPQSLAAIATLLVLGLILIGGAALQNGATWQDGSAFHYALHVDRWTSAIGVAIRDNTGLLSGWTHAFRYAELAAVPLALVPVGRKYTGPLAAACLLFVGLSVGLLFTFGMYGWALAAAACLLIPQDTWDGLAPNRETRLIYDDDCGICLWCARLAKRLDLRGNITFQANSDDEELPAGITTEIADRSMIVVAPDGTVHRDAHALANVLRALPLLTLPALLLRIPGIHHLMRWAYYKVANNRLDISVAVGMGACGIPTDTVPGDDDDRSAPTPAQRTWTALSALIASSGALLVLICVWAQTEKQNEMPVTLGLGERGALVSMATWARIHAPWGLFTPDPPLANEGMVVVAKTRGEYVVDPLTGYPPDENLEQPRRARRGILWATYTANIADDANKPYHKEFRRYLTKGGYAIDTKVPTNYIRELAVYWVKKPTPPPGTPPAEQPEIVREEIFNRRGRITPPRPRLPRVKPPGKE